MRARSLAIVVGFVAACDAPHTAQRASALTSCTMDAQCDDGNPCTTDSCDLVTDTCVNTPITGCCTDDAECASGNFCIVGQCDIATRTCTTGLISNCCHGNSDCSDGNSCTAEVCDSATHQCLYTGIPGCCSKDNDCKDNDRCTTDTCDTTTGICSHTEIAGCCNHNGDCTDGNTCTFDVCNTNQHTCEHLAEPGCCLADSDCNDGNVCTFDSCNLATNVCEHSAITNCCRTVADCTNISTCTTASCDTADNQCVYTQKPNCCTSNSDCNDNNPCTTDTCNTANGVCSNTQIPGCCVTNADCNDNNPCTADVCDSSNTCTNMPIGGCCLSDVACVDDNPCTDDRCNLTSHTCEHDIIVGCCRIDGDCPSGSICRTPRCDPATSTCTTVAVPNCCFIDTDCTTGTCDTTTNTCRSLDLSGGGCACDAHGGSPLGALLIAFAVGAVVLSRRRATLAIVIVAFAAGGARAQGFDAELYQPATSTSAYFSQDGARVLPEGELDVAAAFDYARDPLVAHVNATDSNVVSNRLGFQLIGGYGITRNVEIGVVVPLVLAQDGDLTAIDPTRKLQMTTLGDLRAFGKLGLLEEGALGVAIALDVSVPSGSTDSFTGGRTASARPRLVVGWQRDRWSAAVNVGFRLRGKTMIADVVVGDEFTAGAGAAYAIRPAKLWAIGEAFLAAGLQGGANDVPAEALVGVRGVVSGPLYGQVAIGEGLGRGYATPAFEAIVSMAYVAELKKRTTPPRPTAHDRDGDGIPDELDACPLSPEDKDGYQDADGCPDPDNDGDGIPDAHDKCPNEAEDKDGYQDADGCPDPDNDGDHIVDRDDQCPNEAEDYDGFQDADGCPDPDNDNDGIPDAQDKCPNEPETRNGYQDADGCPDAIPDKVKKFVGVIKGVNFKLGSADLQKSSNKVLDEAVHVLNEFPDVRLEIQGHTDDQPVRAGGKFKDNDELAQARADAVRAYLIAMGVAPNRIVAKGFGPREPLDDPKGLKGGKLAAARARNRRVQFELAMAP